MECAEREASPIAFGDRRRDAAALDCVLGVVRVHEAERASDDQAERQQPQEEPVREPPGENARRDTPVRSTARIGTASATCRGALAIAQASRRERSSAGRSPYLRPCLFFDPPSPLFSPTRRIRPSSDGLPGSALASAGVGTLLLPLVTIDEEDRRQGSGRDEPGDDERRERIAGERRRHPVGQRARVHRPEDSAGDRPGEEAAVGDVGEPHGCVDGEAHPRDVPSGDDQEAGRAVEAVPGRRVPSGSPAPCRAGVALLVALLRAIQNSDVSPTIAPSAPASMTSPSWRASPCGDRRSCAQRRLAGEDRDDRVEPDEQEAHDVGHLLRHLGEPVGNVPVVQELARDDHEQEDTESAEDQSDEVSLPERLLLSATAMALSRLSLARFVS